MNRLPENTLKEIDYYLKVRDYIVNIPMIDYAIHSTITALVTDRLNDLQWKYREESGDRFFLWSEYQFSK